MNISIPSPKNMRRNERIHYANFYECELPWFVNNEPILFNYNGVRSKSLHAEMNAIITYHRKNIKIPKTLIVVGYYKNRLHNSRPCDHCLRIINMFGIKKIIYSTGDENVFKKEKIKDMKFLGPSSGNA